MDIAFDIETIRNGSLIDRLPEPEVRTGNLKDPAKIAEKLAEAKAEQVEKMALSPLYGRVCAFEFCFFFILMFDGIQFRLCLCQKTQHVRSLRAGRRCAAASRFTFFKIETPRYSPSRSRRRLATLRCSPRQVRGR